MQYNGEEYTIRLSRRVKGRVTYDPRTDEIVIILPDQSQWRQMKSGHWDGTLMHMYINHIDTISQLEQQIGRFGHILNHAIETAVPSSDAGHIKTLQENVRLSNELHKAQDRIEELEWRLMWGATEACRTLEERSDELRRAKRERAEARKARDAAEEDSKKMAAKMQETNGEMKRTKARNSRLAAEANKIRTKKRKRYKDPKAGKKGGNRKAHRNMPITMYKTADQTKCHVCHSRLGGIDKNTYKRIVEDMEKGRWEVIQYMVTKRWCSHCKRMQSTPVPGVMPKQRFGNRVLAMLSFLKMIGVSFRKIEMIFLVFYNVHISKKTIQEAVHKVSDSMTAQYEAIHNRILEEESVNGDETSWYVRGLLYWMWCVVGTDAVWFSVQEGRGTDEAKKMLPHFPGIVISDSWPPWNHVGSKHQKCHLHYKRELERTLKENNNPEFQAFAAKLLQILWDSHYSKKGHNTDDDPQTKRRKQRNLMRRLAYLIQKGLCRQGLQTVRQAAAP